MFEVIMNGSLVTYADNLSDALKETVDFLAEYYDGDTNANLNGMTDEDLLECISDYPRAEIEIRINVSADNVIITQLD